MRPKKKQRNKNVTRKKKILIHVIQFGNPAGKGTAGTGAAVRTEVTARVAAGLQRSLMLTAIKKVVLPTVTAGIPAGTPIAVQNPDGVSAGALGVTAPPEDRGQNLLVQ